MLIRPPTTEDAGHACRAVAEDAVELLAVRCQSWQKGSSFTISQPQASTMMKSGKTGFITRREGGLTAFEDAMGPDKSWVGL